MMPWAASGIALSAVAASGSSQADGASPRKRRITTEQEYRDEVMGKGLTAEYGYVMVHEDETISRKVGGKKLIGKWWWKGKYFYRTIKMGSKFLGRDCMTQLLERERPTGRHKEGKAKSFASSQRTRIVCTVQFRRTVG